MIRPLLGIQRQDLRDYLKSLNQPWREDATNRDTKRQRARIREQLIPLLENNFAPTIVLASRRTRAPLPGRGIVLVRDRGRSLQRPQSQGGRYNRHSGSRFADAFGRKFQPHLIFDGR